MRDFRKIIEVLKASMSESNAVKRRIYDKDVAKLLNIPQSKFATIKKRNSTPYVELLHYCKQEGLCCSELFFD
ncbi:hypothetical protein [Sulfurimonas sp.]|uniref:hypothetical protein n=1 Tax=Sulfurimonas sp. TaxID=2022749 RepID=UPI00262645FF|nr:hypothetical protein [Sulfurimonas sp.]